MRIDELVLKVAGDELRVKFHPQLTVLAGLSASERERLTSSIFGALTGGAESTALRYADGTGRMVSLVGEGGTIAARHDDDGSTAPVPLGHIAPSRGALRDLMLVRASDLGVTQHAPRPDEPPELTEARGTLATLTEELQDALGEQRRCLDLDAELADLDRQLHMAYDTIAQREYAEVLAQLERVRAEVAALQSGTAGVTADRKLVRETGTVHKLAARWNQAALVLQTRAEAFGQRVRLDEDDRAESAAMPREVPAGLDAAIEALADAQDERDTLDHRLQNLAVAKLPAPTHLLVGELGLLDQTSLWQSAHRLRDAAAEMDRIQISLGGLGGTEGSEPARIEAIESTHRDVEDAEKAAENLRIPGVATTGLGLSLAMAGAINLPILMPLGLLGAAACGITLLLKPKRRIASAAAIERTALAAVGAPTYLAFHIRRVDATVDPLLRESAEAGLIEHRAAHAAWVELAGQDIDVALALSLDVEVRAYHDALENLGGAADEIEHLRSELAERAEPALASARLAVAELCEPFALPPAALADVTGISAAVSARVEVGLGAQLQAELESAEADESRAAARLNDVLTQLGFDEGPLAARVGALEWAVTRASEREDARARSRPRPEIDAELEHLEGLAKELRRPEWASITAADAAAPDIAELERRREKVTINLDEVRPDVDIERLADRHAAIERRVLSLEAKHGGDDGHGDPGAVADIQRHLFARLTAAGQAGPNGDPVPALLDDVFLRVPADRKWDLLDLLHRLSDQHQLVYLSDDPFVAAWARQHAAAGTVRLLEPEPA